MAAPGDSVELGTAAEGHKEVNETGKSGQDNAVAAEEVARGPDGKPLSRSQQKKLAKAQRVKEQKEEKKAAEKLKKGEQRERRREEVQAKLAAMTEEEREAHMEKIKATREAAKAERAHHKQRVREALESPLRVVIDLDFDGLMNMSEVKSLVSQVNFSYNLAVKGEQQAHLHLLGAKGYVKQQLRAQLPHLDSWVLTCADETYQQRFKDCLQDVVYLTADSPNELQTIDTSKVYIIGGIVDRNRHKRICLDRAEAAGVAHARLPIQKNVQLSTSAVITVNQVVDLLVKGQGPNTDWPAVLAAVLPTRKRAGKDGAAAVADGPAASGGGADSDAGDQQQREEGDGEDNEQKEQEQQEQEQQQQQQQQQQQEVQGENGPADGAGASEPHAKRQKL